MELEPGKILNQRYRIDELLGQGGFGAVYRAWDLNLEIPVALKENREVTPEAQRQFKREARLLLALQHPNLPRVFDSFSLPRRSQYLVMDFVAGRDLESLLAEAGGPLPEQQVLAWLDQVLAALEYLHSQQPPVIHRDLKPANIRLTPTGKAMLVDFGIAKVFNPESRTTGVAQAISPGYSPFEQYGQAPTDARSDLYSLGATLYHLLGGQVPPDSPARVGGAALEPLRALNPAVSPGVAAAVQRALEMQPASRFQTAAEFRQALMQAAAPAPVAPPAAATPSALPWQHVPTERPKTVERTQKVPPGVQPQKLTERILQTDPESPAVTEYLSPDEGKTGRLKFPWRRLSIGVVIILSVALLIYFIGNVIKRQIDLSAQRTMQTQIAPTAAAAHTQAARDFPEGLVLVPAGDFLMGSADSDSQAYFSEQPQHTVFLDAFYIDLYEVTNRLYAECVDAGVCMPPNITSSYTRERYYDDSQYADYPVVYVGWEQARAYCQWRGGDLPTEAQWEKAARGKDGQIYPWGDTFDGSRGNFCDRACPFDVSGKASNNDGYGDTAPVGSYPAGRSPYGLFDMAGNVFEWVLDWYSNYYKSQSTWNNPFGPSMGDTRVMRGGSWNFGAYGARSALRFLVGPEEKDRDSGFRCVHTATDKLSSQAPTPTGEAGQTQAAQTATAGVEQDQRAATQTQSAGLTQAVPSVPEGMALVPAGDFLMGSTDSDVESGDDEKPQHTVYLDAFYIDLSEVTNRKFEEFVQQTGYQTEAEKSGSGEVWNGKWKDTSGADWRHPQGPDSSLEGLEEHPVVQVSWHDAVAYCQWRGGDLPTEAQWEKAARGTDGRIYPWGNTFDGSKLSFCDRSCAYELAYQAWDDGWQFTAPVGSYPAGKSPYGLFDMVGNVDEWVRDWFQ